MDLDARGRHREWDRLLVPPAEAAAMAEQPIGRGATRGDARGPTLRSQLLVWCHHRCRRVHRNLVGCPPLSRPQRLEVFSVAERRARNRSRETDIYLQRRQFAPPASIDSKGLPAILLSLV